MWVHMVGPMTRIKASHNILRAEILKIFSGACGPRAPAVFFWGGGSVIFFPAFYVHLK